MLRPKVFSPETRQRLIGTATIAFAAGALLSGLAGVFWATGNPGRIYVKGVTTERLADGGYELAVDMHAPAEPNCLRMSEHVLFTDSPGQGQGGGNTIETGRVYLPIAATVTGSQFLPNSRDFTLLLKIHPDTAYGTWNYVSRVVFLCSKFPGLLRVKEWQSSPIPVKLDSRKP